jgi:hypothetical protein
MWDWDEDKPSLNLARHGVDFAEVVGSTLTPPPAGGTGGMTTVRSASKRPD